MAKLYSYNEIEEAAPFFRAGDKVRGKTTGIYDQQTRVITYVGRKHVLYELKGDELSTSIAHFRENFEHLPEFFEEDRTYERRTGWSVNIQEPGTEELYVHAVRTNGNGAKVAFGRLRCKSRDGMRQAMNWVVRDQYHFTNESWKLID
jgi:hypothetical protein